jgi:hypothetical protein
MKLVYPFKTLGSFKLRRRGHKAEQAIRIRVAGTLVRFHLEIIRHSPFKNGYTCQNPRKSGLQSGYGEKQHKIVLHGVASRFWIQGSMILGTSGSYVTFWAYPAGGNATKQIAITCPTNCGLTVSLAPH